MIKTPAFQISTVSNIPERIPFWAPDFPNSAANSLTLSGVNGGTRIGPLPLACGCMGAGVVPKGVGGGLGAMRPSNFGSGPAIQKDQSTKISVANIRRRAEEVRTSESKVRCRISSSLVMPNQPKYDAETRRGEEASVFRVCNLPYLHTRNGTFSQPLLRASKDSQPVRRPRWIRTTPSTAGASLVFSKNLTAASPVTTPRLSVSACRKSWPNTLFSSDVRFRIE